MRIDSMEKTDPFDEMTNPSESWNNNEITCYTPLFYSFTDDTHNALLLSYVRELEIHAYENENLDNSLDSPTTDKQYRLVCFIAYTEDSYYNSHITL